MPIFVLFLSDLASDHIAIEAEMDKDQYVYEFDEDRFDVVEYLYENDPGFREECDQECADTGLTRQEVLEQRNIKLASEEEKALKNFKSPVEAQESKDQSPYDKVMKNIETREKVAISALRKRSVPQDDEQDDQAVKSARYSSVKNKKKVHGRFIR